MAIVQTSCLDQPFPLFAALMRHSSTAGLGSDERAVVINLALLQVCIRHEQNIKDRRDYVVCNFKSYVGVTSIQGTIQCETVVIFTTPQATLTIIASCFLPCTCLFAGSHHQHLLMWPLSVHVPLLHMMTRSIPPVTASRVLAISVQLSAPRAAKGTDR